MLENEEEELNDAFETALDHVKTLLADDDAQQCEIEDALVVLEETVDKLRAYQEKYEKKSNENSIKSSRTIAS